VPARYSAKSVSKHQQSQAAFERIRYLSHQARGQLSGLLVVRGATIVHDLQCQVRTDHVNCLRLSTACGSLLNCLRHMKS
jgi:hypothetical protein